MKKTLLMALGMAGVLFLYGYLASSVGHNHSAHGEISSHHGQGDADKSEEGHTNSHEEMGHSH